LFYKRVGVNLKSEVKMSRFDASKDYYSILGAPRGASRDEIERLYKRLAVRHHPDRGGCEERMKTLNEAYDVLRDEEIRKAYDSERRNVWASRSQRLYRDVTPVASPPARADAVYGRFAGALLLMAAGLVLLLLVRFQWIWFLWPLGVLAVFVIILGVFMAHGAMLAMRETLSITHPARHYTRAQEALFWAAVLMGAYGVYLILSAV
jgi:hypothetical protein